MLYSLNKYILLPLLLLFILLSIKFSFMPFGIAKLFIIIGMIVAFFEFLYKKRKLTKGYFYVVLYLFTIILFLLNHTLFMGGNFDSHIYLYILNLTEFLLSSIFFIYIIKNYSEKDSLILIKILIFAILIHSIIIYLNVFIPSTRISENIIPIGGNIDPESFGNLYRVRGLAFSASAGLSIMHSIGAILAFYMITISIKYKDKILYGTFTLLILGSTLFISRTGFFMFFIVIALFILIFNIGYIKNNIKIFNSLLLSILLIVFISWFFLAFFVDKELFNIIIDKFAPWAFEIFLQNEHSGFLESRSTNDLLDNMIFFPQNELTWLIGDGYYDGVNGEGHYIPSDSGYIRTIFAVGLLGTLYIYCFFIFILIYFKKYFRSKSFYGLFFILIFVLLVLDIKMPMIFSGPVSKIIYLIVFMEYFNFNFFKRSYNAV